MANIRLTKRFNFEAAHALYGYDGKCRNIHGHSYHLEVTVIGTPINDTSHVKNGMVMDFGELKHIVKTEIIDDFDHAVALHKHSPHAAMVDSLTSHMDRIILTEYQPTCENMLIDFAARIQARLPEHIKLFSLRLQETPSSFAEWHAADQ